MSKKANPTVIGIFVVGALVLTVAGVVIFGAGNLFSERAKYLLNFDGSLKGLSVGAPVNFKGINVGEVTEIRVMVDREDLSFATPVFIEIDPSRFNIKKASRKYKFQTRAERSKMIDVLVGRGLRAQLELQSLVTGMLLVSLDFHPETPVRLVGNGGRLVKEVPTIPSDMEALTKKVEELPLKELVDAAMEAVEGIKRVVNNPDIGKNLNALTQTQLELQKLMQNIDQQVDPISANLQKTAESISKAAEAATETLETANELVAEDSKLRYNLNNALEELTAAARALRDMADTIQQNPEALIFGKGGGGGK